MKIVAVAIATLIVLIGAVTARLKSPKPSQTLSLETNSSEEVSPSLTETPSIQPTAPIPTRPAEQSQGSWGNLSAFIYPGAKILTQTQTSVNLESFEDPEKITNWYKDKIVSLGMNVKSFVTTKTNDKVLNKLAGADGKREINVEISKDSGTSLVKISVSLKNF